MFRCPEHDFAFCQTHKYMCVRPNCSMNEHNESGTICVVCSGGLLIPSERNEDKALLVETALNALHGNYITVSGSPVIPTSVDEVTVRINTGAKIVRCDPDSNHYSTGGKIVPNLDHAEEAVRTLLRRIGEDPSRNGLLDTPKRVVKMLAEMTVGYSQDPAQILGRVFEEPFDEVIILRDIPFSSLCEHHMLVFTGTVDIGYLPGKVVGLSKLARLVDCFAKRLQMQERMTREIADSIQTHLQAKGVAVVARGSHSCMSCRGVGKHGAEMVTSTMLGAFRDKPEARAEFLALTK